MSSRLNSKRNNGQGKMSNCSSSKKAVSTAQNSQKKSYGSRYLGLINSKKRAQARISGGNNDKLNDEVCSQDQMSLMK